MKFKKIQIIVFVVTIIIMLNIPRTYATTTKKNTTTNTNTKTNVTTSNTIKNNTVVNTNTENVTVDSGNISTQAEIDSLVESLSENGLTKSNLSDVISKYKELSKTYTNEELADMLDQSESDLKNKNINVDNIDNINKVLRNYNADQLNSILDKIDVDDALNQLSSGATLFDVAKKTTEDLSPTDKANLAWSILWSGKTFHIILIVIIIFEIYKILVRCVIYKKAKKHAWAILIPIYRDVVMLKVCGMSPWWLLLLLVPVFGWAILWVVSVASKFMLAEAFDKKEAFGLGLWLLWPIFESILAFSKKSKYVGIQKVKVKGK